MKRLAFNIIRLVALVIKFSILIGIVCLCIKASGQQTTTVKIDPSKDTSIIKFITTTTTSTVTTYSITTVPGIDTTPLPADPNYTLTYSNGYDKPADINTNQLGRGSISTTVFKTGQGSFRSEVRAGDAPISSGWRSEQQYEGSNQNPIEGAVEYDIYYENWTSFDGGGHSIQWHPNTGGGSAIVSLQNYAPVKFDVVRSLGGNNFHQTGILKDVLNNTWYHMRWEFKWSTDGSGYVKLFIDGQLYYSFSGKTADGSGQYLKVGQNRWPYTGNTMKVTSVCYYDNLKIYKRN